MSSLRAECNMDMEVAPFDLEGVAGTEAGQRRKLAAELRRSEVSAKLKASHERERPAADLAANAFVGAQGELSPSSDTAGRAQFGRIPPVAPLPEPVARAIDVIGGWGTWPAEPHKGYEGETASSVQQRASDRSHAFLNNAFTAQEEFIEQQLSLLKEQLLLESRDRKEHDFLEQEEGRQKRDDRTSPPSPWEDQRHDVKGIGDLAWQKSNALEKTLCVNAVVDLQQNPVTNGVRSAAENQHHNFVAEQGDSGNHVQEQTQILEPTIREDERVDDGATDVGSTISESLNGTALMCTCPPSGGAKRALVSPWLGFNTLPLEASESRLSSEETITRLQGKTHSPWREETADFAANGIEDLRQASQLRRSKEECGSIEASPLRPIVGPMPTSRSYPRGSRRDVQDNQPKRRDGDALVAALPATAATQELIDSNCIREACQEHVGRTFLSWSALSYSSETRYSPQVSRIKHSIRVIVDVSAGGGEVAILRIKREEKDGVLQLGVVQNMVLQDRRNGWYRRVGGDPADRGPIAEVEPPTQARHNQNDCQAGLQKLGEEDRACELATRTFQSAWRPSFEAKVQVSTVDDEREEPRSSHLKVQVATGDDEWEGPRSSYLKAQVGTVDDERKVPRSAHLKDQATAGGDEREEPRSSHPKVQVTTVDDERGGLRSSYLNVQVAKADDELEESRRAELNVQATSLDDEREEPPSSHDKVQATTAHNGREGPRSSHLKVQPTTDHDWREARRSSNLKAAFAKSYGVAISRGSRNAEPTDPELGGTLAALSTSPQVAPESELVVAESAPVQITVPGPAVPPESAVPSGDEQASTKLFASSAFTAPSISSSRPVALDVRPQAPNMFPPNPAIPSLANRATEDASKTLPPSAPIPPLANRASETVDDARLEELTFQCRQELHEQQRFVEQRSKELARLRILAEMGRSRSLSRCQSCDAGSLELRNALKAQTAVCGLVVGPLQDMSLPAEEAVDACLAALASAIDKVSHLDPQLAELASYIPQVQPGLAPLLYEQSLVL
eukprot:TRINITY_DN13365_c0_g1_i1.p1 TRINITY_DN13365_c0_g1~~TRINITY_DN13365_c0_g1_i1.p1  ORF type:complete len:1024 (-),score=171.25 TRINITY_DN13365_c0_g1_i1:71-3142(-)